MNRKDTRRPIEEYFPVHEVNQIADKESHAERYYRPIYTMHKWWARRLGSVFRSIVLYSLADENMKVLKKNKNFDNEWETVENLPDPENLWGEYYLEDLNLNGKKVLDPFMGGGTTIVEAIRIGCKVIGKDLNPIAWFTVKKELESVDLERLRRSYRKIEKNLGEEIKKYYRTTCPECGNSADVIYYLWIKELECRNCGHTISLFKNYKVAKARSTNVEHKSVTYCENCQKKFTPGDSCPSCGTKYHHNNYYHVHCPECGKIFETPNYKKENTCPYCENKFNPKEEGNVPRGSKYFICPECGQKNEVIEVIKNQGRPNERLWAIEYYCPTCDKKGYKPAGEEDQKLYKKATEEYEKRKDELPIPNQEIPDGYNTRQMIKQGYEYFKDMFNNRQLLCLGQIFSQILEIEERNIREFLLLAFSDALQYNNMFCEYDYSNRKLSKMFRKHAYHPTMTPVENNVWGTEYGMGSFENIFEKVLAGIEYKKSPFEKYIEKGETKEKKKFQTIETQITGSFYELEHDKNAAIICGDASYLDLPNKSVDAVITDPPYLDNVMYSELSDFYYVWLRKALKDDYEQFQSELTPKRGEILENEVQGKQREDYIKGLGRVFNESKEKLKDDGIMVFTFHHGETEAWASVLKSILDSGFSVSAVYPIQAEMDTSPHIRNKASIEYDMIVVCRKRGKSKEISWKSLEEEIYLRAREEIKELEGKKEISEGDKFVIAMGQTLEVFSNYYPNILMDGEKIIEKEKGISQAIEHIRKLVDEQFRATKLETLEDKTDLETAVYLTFIAGKTEVNFSNLNKSLQQRNISSDIIMSRNFLRRGGSSLKPMKPSERVEKMSKDVEKLSAIDKAHYLYYLYKEDKLGGKIPTLAPYVTDASLETLTELSRIEDKKEYKKLRDFLESKMKTIQKQKGLEEFSE